jgi:hypothetical protein
MMRLMVEHMRHQQPSWQRSGFSIDAASVGERLEQPI